MEPAARNRAAGTWQEPVRHRVALVFTDIVGSTRLLSELGDLAGNRRILDHHRLAAQVVKETGEGEIINTNGDGLFLAFRLPRRALRFALALQRALQTAHPAEPPRLRARDRIGIHFAEVEETRRPDGAKDLTGFEVSVAQRIMTLAAADQVLLTEAAFDAARAASDGGELAEFAELRWLSHGHYELKSVDESVKVFEVGEVGVAPLRPPAEAAAHQAREEELTGWRPASGFGVPGTDWRVERFLGNSRFGEVWLARHAKEPATRVLRFCFGPLRIRALREATPMFDRLRRDVAAHPGVARLHGFQFDRAPHFVESEYVEGLPLSDMCRAFEGKQPPDELARLEIAAQVAEALEAAHQAGVVHGDLRPSAVIVAMGQDDARVPRVKVIDFGVGPLVAGELRSEFALRRTSSGGDAPDRASVAGAPLYWAPELFKGDAPSPASDIYALGVLLYQLLVCDLEQPVTIDVARRISDPLLLDDLLACLATRPGDRLKSAGELATRLRSLPQRRAAAASRDRRAWWEGVMLTSALAGVLVTLLGSLTILAFIKEREAEERAVRLSVAGGVRRMEEGDLSGALEQFVDALGYEHPGTSRYEVQQRRVASVVRSLPRQVQEWRFGENIASLAIDAEGDRIAAGTESGAVHLFSASTGQHTAFPQKLPGQATTIGFLSDPPILFAHGAKISPAILTGHVLDAGSLASRLKGGTRAVEIHLRSAIPADSRAAIDAWNGGAPPTPEMTAALAAALNAAVDGPFLWDERRFADVTLRQSTQELVDDKLGGRDFRLANRLLLEDAFPSELWKVQAAGPLMGWALSPDVGESKAPQVLFPDAARVAASGDGRWLAIAGDGPGIHLLPARGGAPVKLAHDRHVERLALNRDGAWLVVAGSGTTNEPFLTLWNTAMRAKVATVFRDATAIVDFMSFDAASHVLGVAFRESTRTADGRPSTAHTTAMFGLPGLKPMPPERRHGDSILWAGFAQRGTWFLSAATGSGSRARITDIFGVGGVPVELPHPHSVVGGDLTPDGRYVLTACFDRHVRLWDPARGQLVCEPLRHPASQNSEFFRIRSMPDGRRIVTGVDDAVRVFDLASHASTVAPLELEVPLDVVEVSPDGRRIAAANISTSPGIAAVWDSETGRRITKRLRHPGALRLLAFNRDGTKLFTAEAVRAAPETNGVWVTDLDQTNAVPRRLAIIGKAPVGLFVGPDDSLNLVTADGSWLHWSPGTPADAPGVRQLGVPVKAAYPSADGSLVATLSPPGQAGATNVGVWRTATGERTGPTIHAPHPIRRIAFNRDNTRVLTACTDGTFEPRAAIAWDVATGRSVGPELPHEDGVLTVASHPGSDRVVTGGEDSLIRFWDPRQPEIRVAEQRMGYQVLEVVYDRTGNLVAAASADGSARVWEGATGEPVTPVLRHPDRVRWVAFADDARKLITRCDDGCAYVWDLTPFPGDRARAMELAVDVKRDGDPGHAAAGRNWEEIRARSGELLRVVPAAAAAWHRIEADRCLQSGEPEMALAQLDRAIALQPDHWPLRWRRARLLARLGRPESKDAFLEVVKLDPDCEAARSAAGIRIDGEAGGSSP